LNALFAGRVEVTPNDSDTGITLKGPSADVSEIKKLILQLTATKGAGEKYGGSPKQ
jgi:hypothetical protein